MLHNTAGFELFYSLFENTVQLFWVSVCQKPRESNQSRDLLQLTLWCSKQVGSLIQFILELLSFGCINIVAFHDLWLTLLKNFLGSADDLIEISDLLSSNEDEYKNYYCDRFKFSTVTGFYMYFCFYKHEHYSKPPIIRHP